MATFTNTTGTQIIFGTQVEFGFFIVGEAISLTKSSLHPSFLYFLGN